MAKPTDSKSKTAKKMQAQADSHGEIADILNGKTPSGKVYGKDKKAATKKPDPVADFDKFLRSFENGFTDKTPDKNDKPYGGLLPKISVKRLVKTTNK